MLLITWSHLHVAKASSSLKCPDTHHATPTFITEVFHLATYVKLLLKWFNGLYMLIRLFFTKCINAKATPTNNTDYSFYIEAVELVQPIIWEHMKPLVINTLRGTNTHTRKHTRGSILSMNTHTDIRTDSFLRNPVHTCWRPAHACFPSTKKALLKKMQNQVGSLALLLIV